MENEQDHLDFFQQLLMWLKAVRLQVILPGMGLKQTQKSEGPLALIVRDMSTEADQAYMIAEDATMQVDPLLADAPWARNRVEPII